MDKPDVPHSSYWNLMTRAETALADGDFPLAERLYHEADERRRESPGRVFLTERVRDGLAGLWRRGKDRGAGSGGEAGRWQRRRTVFETHFCGDGNRVVREGVRLAELRPEDDAEANQPALESALFLVSRSCLFGEEPDSAVPLLKALFRTARRTGRPFDVQLVRHDIPLTEEDRLWLARRGGELLESFVDQGRLERGGRQAEEWAAVFLQLLQGRYFGSTSRLEEERAWLEAVTADRLLDRAAAAVELYRSYLAVNSEPGPRADEARVRLLELLANADGLHFPVPRYREALGSLQAAGLAAGSAVAGRYEAALARIEYRCPALGADPEEHPVWASFALAADGALVVVKWWDAEPRDSAQWRPGEDPGPLVRFLESCGDRLVPAAADERAAVRELSVIPPAPGSAADFAAAFLTDLQPEAMAPDAAQEGFILAEVGPWRGGWNPTLGLPDLEPPRGGAAGESGLQGPAAGAIGAGLLWLAIRSRILAADPSLSAGVGELARRGDAASSFLYDFLTLAGEAQRAVDLGFEPWTLPLLWTRPDPLVRRKGAAANADDPAVAAAARPDLGRNQLAIVSTGSPAAILSAWNDGRQKWRVVLDRIGRLAELPAALSGIVGPVTVLPPAGSVYCLDGALDLLESLLNAGARPADPVEDLLPLYHWVRLVESHNGDLLDVLHTGDDPAERPALQRRYSELVQNLPRELPILADEPDRRTWGGQFTQRVRKSGLVTGTYDLLMGDAERLDGLWGLYEGSDASWVFLDSAAIHWSLYQRGDQPVGALHDYLFSRGKRHLSLVTGATWLRGDLETLLGDWLQVYGAPYCLSLTDARPGRLHLADRGVVPDAVRLGRAARRQAVATVDSLLGEQTPGTILLPESGSTGEFWKQVASGVVPLAGENWNFAASESACGATGDNRILVLPVLASFGAEMAPVAAQNTRQAWAVADRERTTYCERLRRLCNLELAALSAGPWRRVEVLDTRWRRLLRGAADQGRDVAEAGQGSRSTSAAPEEEIQTFALSDPDAGNRKAASSERLRRVDEWRPSGGAETEEEAVSLTSAEGIWLLNGMRDEVWRVLSRRLASAREQGELSEWVLVVAESPPPGAAGLVAGAGTAGASVWSSAGPDRPPAPLLWCRPDDARDPALAAYLQTWSPTVILTDDLTGWLPAVGDEGLVNAHALRVLLDCGAPRIYLEGARLPQSWRRFLARACRATPLSPPAVSAAGRDTAAAEAETPPLASDLEPGPAAAAEIRSDCLDCGEATTARAVVDRLSGLLQRLRPVLAELEEQEEGTADGPAPLGSQLVPLDWLGHLAGLPDGIVADGVRTLRWAARLAGDSLSAAGADSTAGPTGHSLLIRCRYAELESVLDRLREHLRVLLPLWLDGGLPGEEIWLDLEAPPARIQESELVLLDRLLTALGDPNLSDWAGLTYRCPRGLLNSTRRLVRCRDRSDAVLARLEDQIRLFGQRIGDVLSSAVETGEGFLVETGLSDLRDEEREFLACGVVLGFWRWVGPPGPGTLHLVDMLTLADSPTAQPGSEGRTLLAEWVGARLRGAESDRRPAGAPQSETRGLGNRLTGGLRNLLPGQDQEHDLHIPVARVAEVARGSERMLVLKGLVGTGRHEILVLGLLAAARQRGGMPEVTVFCPDPATAAGFARQARRAGWSGPLDLRVASKGTAPVSVVLKEGRLADTSSAIHIMVEIQRFEPEMRYRIAQMGRDRRLIMTVDPASANEPWEHLFLTTPRTDDVLELDSQRHQARALWQAVRHLVPESLAGRPGTRRRDRGNLIADYAANLDQCLSRVIQEHGEGRLPDRIRLTAGLAADLDYLGSAFRERGWLAVPDKGLDTWFQPGTCEFLAAATDELARGGALGRAFDFGETDPEPLLPCLLGPGAAAARERWLSGTEPLPVDATVGEFHALVAPTGWLGASLAHPWAREELTELLAQWRDRPLAELVNSQTWEGWWYTLLDETGLTGPIRRRPLVALAAAARSAGTFAAGGVYLCLGAEPARQHYEVLGRVTDQALILYQESSPLPS